MLTDDVADLALGLMLATSRQIVAAHKFIEAGEWAAAVFPWTQKVSGSRVGIVGHGAHRPGHRPALRGVRHADCLS
ncbi:D-isomer specific 2-hydroxyacid dehydrogenase family protein [Klebsiella aerogenes]|nr:D-isomer specific 2-hydroxyacid dehydrogenase family protein [Klebsiella aerogenes]